MKLSSSSFNMAGNDGTSAELFPGWSSVVHQPAEDPEESDLPSTVDITAFTSGLSVEPNNTGQNDPNSDSESDSEPDSSNSGTDASQSCSQSDSSDSDSSTSSQSSRSSPGHEFSVTSSQTNGLRLTIATKRKQSPVEEKDSGKSSCSQTAKRPSSSSSGSAASSDSESASADSDPTSAAAKRNGNNARKGGGASKGDLPATAAKSGGGPSSRAAVKVERRMVMRSRAKAVEKKDEKAKATVKKEVAVAVTVGAAGAKAVGGKTRQRQRRARKMASLPLSRGSTCSSTDADDSDDADGMLASCSLQEIRQEDLAAILPDQQEMDAFELEGGGGGVGGGQRCSPAAPDLSGGSDMELPQQAVNALIERTTESSSDGEHHAPPNPGSLYANSLLQQFVAQTQLLNAPPPQTTAVAKAQEEEEDLEAAAPKEETAKRRRGRPRKEQPPNVSPDSGIQNSPARVSSPEEEAVAAVRRVGRPPLGRRGPGRPPKGVTEPVVAAAAGAVGKGGARGRKAAKGGGRQLPPGGTCRTLQQVPKLMHSRRHRKHKFKVLRAAAARGGHQPPKAAIEIDALVADFVRCCAIAEPPPRPPLKKVAKKRKTAEHAEKKKKKQGEGKVNDSDEQRLPLKKRHYHLVNSTESRPDEETADDVDDHVTEAIEACVSRLSAGEEKPAAAVATTPKKRHRLEAAGERPKVSVEGFMTELRVKRSLAPKSPAREDKRGGGEQGGGKVSPESAKKKVRKRRAINRTGFPTVKKKKKKPADPTVPNPAASQGANACDRVPKEGEQCSEFVQRTEKPASVPAAAENSPSDDGSSKWEFLSECESLPQEERTEFEEDSKPDRMTLRRRDLSPATSVETRSTRSKHDELDVDLDVSLESSIERLRSRLEERKKRKRTVVDKADTNGYPKRKLRDASPAGSAEALFERRPKEDAASASGDEKRGKKAPRKKYLVAGLFSDYYKEDDPTARLAAPKPSSRLAYDPADHPHGLLPPPRHCGRHLRRRHLPFRLPYDVWRQRRARPRPPPPARHAVPSWNYRKVRTNVYGTRGAAAGAGEPQACNCPPDGGGCGDDCINRLVLAECPAAGHRCDNQRIQRHEWAPGLEKFMTEAKGWGVRTKLPIRTGEFILEYVGEVVSEREFKQRMATTYADDTHHYCLHLDAGLFIDGHRTGGDGRFVNHSCAPNCEMQKWSVNGQFRMAMFALRDIAAGEELTYDYNFSLFNAAEGQECKCGSRLCRGVIGGKSQRVRQLPPPEPPKAAAGRVGRPRKTEAKRKAAGGADGEKVTAGAPAPAPAIQVRPMSHQQQCFVSERRCFLLRNLAKVRKARDRSLSAAPGPGTAAPTETGRVGAPQKARSVKTRRPAHAEGGAEPDEAAKLAAMLKEVWAAEVKDETGPGGGGGKRKAVEPPDLAAIGRNVAAGAYRTAAAFEEDLRAAARRHGRTSPTAAAAARIERACAEARRRCLGGRKEEAAAAVGSGRKKSEEEEDVIRCICGIPRDEGLMIQCERCLAWQHCECVRADASASSYHCERCAPRRVDYEIPTDELTEHRHRYYLTLMRGELQLRQGDTVYVLRDIPIEGTDRKHTYETIGEIDYAELDIFRIERLWKEEGTGRRLAYGHHYLRPHETFHEPTRKFFPNEVMRVPLYEAVPVELIVSRCWVLDVNTFCKGRPIGADERHVYICEYRVDKAAKMFSKASRSKYPVCTKSFAFEKFETRLKISRTYCPHDVDEALMKGGGRRAKPSEEAKGKQKEAAGKQKEAAGKQKEAAGKQKEAAGKQKEAAGKQKEAAGKQKEAAAAGPPPVVRTLSEQRTRLNRILLNLLGKLPTKQALDASYLLEGGRRRKKPTEHK